MYTNVNFELNNLMQTEIQYYYYNVIVLYHLLRSAIRYIVQAQRYETQNCHHFLLPIYCYDKLASLYLLTLSFCKHFDYIKKCPIT